MLELLRRVEVEAAKQFQEEQITRADLVVDLKQWAYNTYLHKHLECGLTVYHGAEKIRRDTFNRSTLRRAFVVDAIKERDTKHRPEPANVVWDYRFYLYFDKQGE